MEPINWFMKVVTQHYFDFNGRARRAEFWWYILVNFIIAIILNVIGSIIHLNILGSLFALALLLPSLGVMVRRLHDIGRSGWWYFIVLVPLVGVILLIYWFAQPGVAGPNEYGPDPKAVA